jgi:tail collar domain
MPLNISFETGGVDPAVAHVLDEIIAPLQMWAGKIDGLNTAERLNELTSGISNIQGVPTGALFQWPTATVPVGFLLCDGSAVARSTYATLYGVIGTLYGVGDGVTSFNLPDFRGILPVNFVIKH